MNFFKIITTTIAIVIGSPAFSQISIWPKAGANLAWITYPSNSNVSQRSPSNVGFYGGVAIDILTAQGLSIRPEIVYYQLNVSWNAEHFTTSSNGSIAKVMTSRNEKRQYISLPINIVKHFGLGKNDFQVALGGYIGQGLNGGSYNQQYTQISNDGTAIYTEGHGNMIAGTVPPLTGSPVPPGTVIIASPIPLPYYNPFDAGINIGFGYQINKLLITTQLGIGLSNTQPHYDDSALEDSRGDAKTSNRSVALGIAYRIFNSKI